MDVCTEMELGVGIELSYGLIPDPHVHPTPEAEKSPFQIVAKRLEIDENVNRTAFAKPQMSEPQLGTQCGRQAAWLTS